MKEKIITVILNILILVLPIVIMPSASLYNIPKIIALLLIGLMLFVLLMINYKKLTIDKTDILVLIFAGLVFLSTMFSSNIKNSIFGAFGRYEGMLTYYAYIIIYFCTKKFYKSNENTTLKILYVLFISISILGILQHFISIPELYPIFNKGVCGSFGNTNFMGSFVSIGIPVFTILYITKGYKLSFLTARDGVFLHTYMSCTKLMGSFYWACIYNVNIFNKTKK